MDTSHKYIDQAYTKQQSNGKAAIIKIGTCSTNDNKASSPTATNQIQSKLSYSFAQRRHADWPQNQLMREQSIEKERVNVMRAEVAKNQT